MRHRARKRESGSSSSTTGVVTEALDLWSLSTEGTKEFATAIDMTGESTQTTNRSLSPIRRKLCISPLFSPFTTTLIIFTTTKTTKTTFAVTAIKRVV
jgi:hypothetical protein